ncbi:MAG: site-2 protease family protein [Micromonosporaceae bacterium]|nr:site-2 protease family protein [Micromonosporaceae bacterium]
MEDHVAPPPANAPAASEPARARRSGIPLGRVAGVPVVLTYAWLFLGALITFTYGQFVQVRHPDLTATVAYVTGFGMVVCLLVSVLLHEVGHAVVARRFGIGVRGITLELLGGYTEMDRDAPTPKVELLVALAGPAVSGVLGISAVLATAILPGSSLLHEVAFQLAFSNVIVAVFNALPGLPLDGGRALRAGIWAATRNRNAADRVAGWTGRVVAVASFIVALLLTAAQVLSLLGLVITVMVAVSLWSGATQAIRMGQIGQQLPLVNAGRLARPLYPVTTGTPLAEAERQLAEARHQMAGAPWGAARVPEPVMAVVDSGGRLLGVVNGEAASAVPVERRPWVTIDTVARTLQPNQVLSAELSGMDMIRAVQANPATEYVVTTGEDVIGVLRVADLMNVLEARGHA